MEKGKSIMLQGTASSVGKSLLTAALCRIFRQEGYNAAPFKSQNMASNSFITEEGFEMGKAQAAQAEAAGIKPSAYMNPILLKPSGDRQAEVIIKGKTYKSMTAMEYHEFKPQLKEMITEVYNDLISTYDILVIEGAGSPAEINLRDKDIVNMGMAEIADCPVLLVGDIDRGGVFASIYGTIMLFTKEERRRVKGILINKFRGDRRILEPGLKMLEDLTGIPVVGVIPYGDFNIEDEDSLTQRFTKDINTEGKVTVEIVQLPHIANFTDFHVFETLPDVHIRYISRGESIGNPDILILPDSKNVIEDMKYLRESGLERDIMNAYKNGSYIFGISAGYEILGQKILDPHGLEGNIKDLKGIGLLDIETIFEQEKRAAQVEGEVAFAGEDIHENCKTSRIKGFVSHIGKSILLEGTKPFLQISVRANEDARYTDGAVSRDGRVFGTYLHGIFDEIDFTQKFIDNILREKGLTPSSNKVKTFEEFKNQEYAKLAKLVKENIDLEKIYKILEG